MNALQRRNQPPLPVISVSGQESLPQETVDTIHSGFTLEGIDHHRDTDVAVTPELFEALQQLRESTEAVRNIQNDPGTEAPEPQQSEEEDPEETAFSERLSRIATKRLAKLASEGIDIDTQKTYVNTKVSIPRAQGRDAASVYVSNTSGPKAYPEGQTVESDVEGRINRIVEGIMKEVALPFLYSRSKEWWESILTSKDSKPRQTSIKYRINDVRFEVHGKTIGEQRQSKDFVSQIMKKLDVLITEEVQQISDTLDTYEPMNEASETPQGRYKDTPEYKTEVQSMSRTNMRNKLVTVGVRAEGLRYRSGFDLHLTVGSGNLPGVQIWRFGS